MCRNLHVADKLEAELESVFIGADQRWARDPPESLDHNDPPPFLSLDPSLEKGIEVLKVSIPVSKKDLSSENFEISISWNT